MCVFSLQLGQYRDWIAGFKRHWIECHITMAGDPSTRNLKLHPVECTDDNKKAAVRCCDDSGNGFSQVPLCNDNKNFREAVKICKDYGKRLCNTSELAQTKGTGCHFNNKRTWTSGVAQGDIRLLLLSCMERFSVAFNLFLITDLHCLPYQMFYPA